MSSLVRRFRACIRELMGLSSLPSESTASSDVGGFWVHVELFFWHTVLKKILNFTCTLLSNIVHVVCNKESEESREVRNQKLTKAIQMLIMWSWGEIGAYHVIRDWLVGVSHPLRTLYSVSTEANRIPTEIHKATSQISQNHYSLIMIKREKFKSNSKW